MFLFTLPKCKGYRSYTSISIFVYTAVTNHDTLCILAENKDIKIEDFTLTDRQKG